MDVPTWHETEDGLKWGDHALIEVRGYADNFRRRMVQLCGDMEALVKAYERGGARGSKPDTGTQRSAAFWEEIARGFLAWAQQRPCLNENEALCQQAQQTYWREINRARGWARSAERKPPLGWHESEMTLAMLEGFLRWQQQ